MRYDCGTKKGCWHNMKKIWVNGCFDIIHRGHIELFKYAKSLGDFLIVGLDTDSRISGNKGDNRPINKLEDRMVVLDAIKYIDIVLDFNSTDELEYLIKDIKPDIMIIGSDWKDKKIIGEKYAGKVEFFDRIEGYSTTKILESYGS